MKVGDLVRAYHWRNGEVAILLSFGEFVFVVAIGNHTFDQNVEDLEVINESR